MATSSFARLWGSLALSASLVWTQTMAVAAPQRTAAPASLRDQAAAFYRVLRELEQGLERSSFDPEALAARLSDLEAAYAFVRDEIALVPYEGVQRGAAGTLASRAGNACDQALLLAELLQAQGRRTRFALAELDAGQVARLRAALDRPETATSRPKLRPPLDSRWRPLFALAGADGEEVARVEAEQRQRLEALAAHIESAFAAGATGLAALYEGAPPPASGEPQARASLARHCWVQVETEAGWLDLDPTLAEFEPGDRLRAPDAVLERLPLDLRPQLTLRLLVHREEGGERRSAALLEESVPLGEAVFEGRLLVIPEIRRGEAAGGVVGALLEDRDLSRFASFVPLFAVPGRSVAVGLPFALDGRPLATDFNARVARAVGETVGGGFAGAIGALGSLLDEPAPAPTSESRFSGLELVLELALPGGERRTSRRLLVPPAPEEELGGRLFLSVDLVASAARIPSDLFQAVEIAAWRAARPLVEAALSADPLREGEAALGRLWQPSLALWEFLKLRAAFAEELAARSFPALVRVPDGPLVVALHQRLVPGDDGWAMARAFDLVFKRERVLARDPNTPAPAAAPAEMLRRLSLLDAALEDAYAGPEGQSGLKLLAAAAAQGIALRRLGDVADLATIEGMPAYARSLIIEALAAGQRVLVPERPPVIGGRPYFAFWRLDPASGELLAVGADGTGQAMAEYKELIVVTAIGAVVGCAVSWALGDLSGASDVYLCLAISMAIGILVGGAVSWLAGRLPWLGAKGQAAAGGALGGAGSWLAGRTLGGGRPPAPTPPPATRGPALTPPPNVPAALPPLPPRSGPPPVRAPGRGPIARPARGGTIPVPATRRPSPFPPLASPAKRPAPLAAPRRGAARSLQGLGTGGRGGRPPAAAVTGPKARASTPAPGRAVAAVPRAKTTPSPAAGARKPPVAGRPPASAKPPAPAAAGARQPLSAGPRRAGGEKAASAKPTGATATRGKPPSGRNPADAAKGPPRQPQAAPSGPSRRPVLVRPRPQRPVGPRPAAPTAAPASGTPRIGTGPRARSPSSTPKPKLAQAGGGKPPAQGRKAAAGGAADPRPAWLRETGGYDFDLATPAPKPYRVLDNLTPEQRAWLQKQPPEVRELIRMTNMPVEDVQALMKLAKAHYAYIGTRTLNPVAPRHYSRGAVGKDMFMKGKSADRGAIQGLIPEDQALSKLGTRLQQAKTEQEKLQIWKEIQKANQKVQDAIQSGRYKLMTYQVDGNDVYVYRKGRTIYQAYEKDGVVYDATTRRALGPARDFAKVKPLRVVAKEVVDPATGAKRLLPVTADIDLDFVAFNPNAPKAAIARKDDPELGSYSERVKAILQGMRNLAKAQGREPRVLHGPEQFNPFPEPLRMSEYPKAIFGPDGKVWVLENPADQWNFFRELRLRGWQNPLRSEWLEKQGWDPDNWWRVPPDNIKPYLQSSEGARPAPRRRTPQRHRPAGAGGRRKLHARAA